MAMEYGHITDNIDFVLSVVIVWYALVIRKQHNEILSPRYSSAQFVIIILLGQTILKRQFYVSQTSVRNWFLITRPPSAKSEENGHFYAFRSVANDVRPRLPYSVPSALGCAATMCWWLPMDGGRRVMADHGDRSSKLNDFLYILFLSFSSIFFPTTRGWSRPGTGLGTKWVQVCIWPTIYVQTIPKMTQFTSF